MPFSENPFNWSEVACFAMKFTVYLITFFTAMIGMLISLFLLEFITISKFGNLTATQLSMLLQAVMWFIIALITYIGVQKTSETGFSFLSLDFLLTWLFCDIGVILGDLSYVLIKTQALSIELTTMMTLFLATLPLALGPTATAALGLKTN